MLYCRIDFTFQQIHYVARDDEENMARPLRTAKHRFHEATCHWRIQFITGRVRLAPMIVEAKTRTHHLSKHHIYTLASSSLSCVSTIYTSLSLKSLHVFPLDLKMAVSPSKTIGHRDRKTCASSTDPPVLPMGSPVGSEDEGRISLALESTKTLR